MSTAGQWTIINWLIENRFIDVLVSTGANVSEDIVDAMGLGYWQGSHMVDDSALLKADVNRYYDVFGKETDYRKMEELVTDFVMTLKTDYYYTSAEFLHLLGKYLGKKKIQPYPPSQPPTGFQSSAQQWLTAPTAKPSSWQRTKDTVSRTSVTFSLDKFASVSIEVGKLPIDAQVFWRKLVCSQKVPFCFVKSSS